MPFSQDIRAIKGHEVLFYSFWIDLFQ